MKSQVLIASYAKDFIWLIHCLGSLKRFSSGFLHPVICVESHEVAACREVCERAYPECTVVVKNGRLGQGFMRAQIAMMSADLLCPDADFIFLLGSDTIAAGPFTPQPFFHTDGRPVMLHTTYQDLNRPGHSNAMPWRLGVQRILGWQPEAEYMRRLPLVYPRSLFPAMRDFIANLQRQEFEHYIYTADLKYGHTSESNCLGAYAAKYMPEIFHWVDTTKCTHVDGEIVEWPSPVRQFWGRGTLDRITEANFRFGDGKSSKGRTPREIMDEILYNIPAPRRAADAR